MQEYPQSAMMQKEFPTFSPGSVPAFIPLFHVRLAYGMIPGAFWFIFCVEIKKACSMDFPTVFMSSLLEPQFKIQNMTHSGLKYQMKGNTTKMAN